jgi:hypothetical protein
MTEFFNVFNHQPIGRSPDFLPLPPEILKLETSLIQEEGRPPDTLILSALEDQIDSLLRSHGWMTCGNWLQIWRTNAPKPEVLETLFDTLDPDTVRAALVRIAASLHEIENSVSRISDLVRAIQGIYLDGPVSGAER